MSALERLLDPERWYVYEGKLEASLHIDVDYVEQARRELAALRRAVDAASVVLLSPADKFGTRYWVSAHDMTRLQAALAAVPPPELAT